MAVCAPWGVVVCGLDDTLARRRGDHIQATGLARDPGRSSHAPVVHVRGWRWLCGRRLTPRAGAGRVWALPGMTVRCPSPRCDAPQGRCHHTRSARAGPIIPVVVRWVPGRALVVVADSREAAREWLQEGSKLPRARLSTRRRLAAALEALPPARQPGPRGQPRRPGHRRPTLEAVLAEAATPWSQLTVARW